MMKLAAGQTVFKQAKRFYNLRFHEHEIISTRKKIGWFVVSFSVIPATIWAYFFYREREHLRLQHEAEFGRPFFKPFPRTLKPFPWGDGQTPFFKTMKHYWGFKDDE